MQKINVRYDLVYSCKVYAGKHLPLKRNLFWCDMTEGSKSPRRRIRDPQDRNEILCSPIWQEFEFPGLALRVSGIVWYPLLCETCDDENNSRQGWCCLRHEHSHGFGVSLCPRLQWWSPTELGSHRHDTRRIGVDFYLRAEYYRFHGGIFRSTSETSEPSTFFSCWSLSPP